MKRRSLWFTSIFGILVMVTLAFQNCNNKKYTTTASSNLKGSLDSMDSGGEIDGEVIVKDCEDPEDLDTDKCPSVVKIKFYAIEANSTKTFIGDTDATAQETIDGEGDASIKYVFSFTVPSEHICKKIEAYAVEPTTLLEILIQPDEDFILWDGKKQCETFDGGSNNGGSNNGGSNNGGSNNGGSNNGGSTNGGNTNGGGSDPFVEIDGVNQDGRLVEVFGKCESGANVVFSGDVHELINKTESCSNDAFRHCDFLTKNNANNHIVAKQTIGNKMAEDSVDVMGANPHLVLTFDSFVKSGTKGLAVTGKCTPGAKVKLYAYNNEYDNVTCDALGNYSSSKTPLIPNLTNRVILGKLVSLFGNAEIKADADSENASLSCSISETVARSGFCTKQAGTVKGSCVAGLPVHIYVNGNKQNLGFCPSGTFEVKNVLLEKVGMSNTIKIEQVNPYGKSCSATKVLTQF